MSENRAETQVSDPTGLSTPIPRTSFPVGSSVRGLERVSSVSYKDSMHQDLDRLPVIIYA